MMEKRFVPVTGWRYARAWVCFQIVTRMIYASRGPFYRVMLWLLPYAGDWAFREDVIKAAEWEEENRTIARAVEIQQRRTAEDLAKHQYFMKLRTDA